MNEPIQKKSATVPVAVREFDSLPDSCLLDMHCAGLISARSRASLNRHFDCGELTRVKLGGSTRVRVGELRRLIGAMPEAVAQ